MSEEINVESKRVGLILGKVVDAALGYAITYFKCRLTFSSDRQAGEPSSGLPGAAATKEGELFANDDGSIEIGGFVQGMDQQVSTKTEYQLSDTDRFTA